MPLDSELITESAGVKPPRLLGMSRRRNSLDHHGFLNERSELCGHEVCIWL